MCTLKYLSRYVSRTAITNDRIESMENGHVTFRYRRQGEQKDRRMRVPVFEFLRRFLQHVLPKRMHKIRHYGLLSRRSKTDLDGVRAAILKCLADVDPDLELESELEDGSAPTLPRREDAGPRCPVWNHPLTFECFTRIRPPPLTKRGLARANVPVPLSPSRHPPATRFENVKTESDRGLR